MRIDYPDNSFMLSWQKCRAWYNPDGSLKDAEYKRSNGRTVSVSAKHIRIIAWLSKQGQTEANLLSRGILKRKI